MSRWGWKPYVPVATRQARARKKMEQLRKQGVCIQPVEVAGRTIAKSFWGKGWCNHLESFSDFENRLPRGRTYVRNGSVCHLAVAPGKVEAKVSGSQLYTVTISIKKLDKAKWERMKESCAGKIGSLIELLQGKLSSEVMAVVTQQQQGLFPLPGEIKLDCSCPDWATMCKHVAAVLYGVGSRLDNDPGLLFTLRGVDAQELITQDVLLPTDAGIQANTLHEDSLADIFGIDLDDTAQSSALPKMAAKPAAAAAASDTPKRKPKTTSTSKQPAKPSGTKASQKQTQSTPPPQASPKTRSAPPSTSRSRPASTPAPRPKPFVPRGSSIAKLRAKAGLSVPEFAARLNVSPGSVYRWENTRGRVSMHDRCLEALRRMSEEVETKA